MRADAERGNEPLSVGDAGQRQFEVFLDDAIAPPDFRPLEGVDVEQVGIVNASYFHGCGSTIDRRLTGVFTPGFDGRRIDVGGFRPDPSQTVRRHPAAVFP